MSRFTTQTVSAAERLVALAGEWRDLWHRTGSLTPFQSPDWLLPWWDVFAPGELRLITVRRGGTLVAIAPLYLEEEAPGPRLLPLGISLSDYLDVVVDPDFAEEAAVQIAGAVSAMEEIGTCEFAELPPEAEALRIPTPEKWANTVSPASVCPVLTLPATATALGQYIPHSRLRHLRTARRRVARRGDSAILEGDADNAGVLLAELVRLHTLRWGREQKPGVFSDSRVAEFHAAALPGLMQQQIVRLYALQIGARTVGVYYGFSCGRRAFAYLCGYDCEFAFESPGAILIGHAIEQAVGDGSREFHFLRGGEAYKYEWGARDRWNVRRLLSRPQAAFAHG